MGPSLDALLAANLNGVLRPAAPDLWRQAIAPDRAGLVGLSMGSASGTGTRRCGLIRGCPGERGSMRSGARQEFQHMAVGIPKVDAAPTTTGVDLSVL